MTTHKSFPMTAQKAAYCKFMYFTLGMKMTHIAIILEVNVGSVSKVINRHRFEYVSPMEPPFLADAA